MRVPENIEDFFEYHVDDKTGDYKRFHLYLYYEESLCSVLVLKRHHEWKISGTEYAVQRNQGRTHEELENEYRERHEELFKEEIVRWLECEKRRLIPMTSYGDKTILVLISDEASVGK